MLDPTQFDPTQFDPTQFDPSQFDDIRFDDARQLAELDRELEYRRRVLAARRARARRRRQARIRRNRLVALTVLMLLVAFGYGLDGLVGNGSSRPSAATANRLISVQGPSFTVSGRLSAHLPWPAIGEGAVGVEGVGVMASSPRQRIVPIASMTKMMTALVLLADHPLAPGESGPILRMTKADARLWVLDSQSGDSTVPVQVGERLSEYQLLEGLLMASGDNLANLLATWDAGSLRAFVAKMNATAHRLGLTHTHYADPSGLNPASRSTPSDQVVVASALMNDPVARQIVAQRSIAFPVAGTIGNYNPALGTDGIVGVKSGFTHEAAGCLTVAALRRVGGRTVTLISVVTGSPNALYGAAATDRALLAAALPELRLVAPTASTSAVKVRIAGAARRIEVKPTRSLPKLVLWPGASVSSRLRARTDAFGGRGRAMLTLTSGASTLATMPVLVSALGQP